MSVHGSGAMFDRRQLLRTGGLTLSLGMDLAARSDLPIDATAQAVDCVTGDPLGQPEAAELRDRVANRGSLELRWLTSREWTGCRTLTLAFAVDGWHGASATFGPVAFGAGGAAAKR